MNIRLDMLEDFSLYVWFPSLESVLHMYISIGQGQNNWVVVVVLFSVIILHSDFYLVRLHLVLSTSNRHKVLLLILSVPISNY